jgi:hypothetical protein
MQSKLRSPSLRAAPGDDWGGFAVAVVDPRPFPTAKPSGTNDSGIERTDRSDGAAVGVGR